MKVYVHRRQVWGGEFYATTSPGLHAGSVAVATFSVTVRDGVIVRSWCLSGRDYLDRFSALVRMNLQIAIGTAARFDDDCATRRALDA